MPFLRQSTTQTIRFGPFLDATDGVTEETGLTITQALRRISKDGGAFAQSNHIGNSTHDSDGWYSDDLDTTDTNTVGELILNVQDPTTHLPVWMRWWVIEEAVYDAIYGASAVGPALASVVGTLADAAAAGDPTSADTVMQYIKQLINVLVGTTGVTTFPAEAAPANNVSLSEVIRAIHTDVTGLNGDAMRGTDNAALASVLGALADAAAAGDPTSADTVMQYVKQLINVLVGTTGVTTFPAEAAPANNVSLAEVIRAIHTDTSTTLDGRIPAALVSGRMDSSVGAVAAGAITAAAIATDAVDADALATDAVNEIRDAILPESGAALSNIEFLFVSSGDHVTPVTGATGTAVTRSIDGGAFAAGTGTLAEVANGIYQYDASVADMTGGIITFRFTGTGGTPAAPDDAFVTVVTGAGV